MESRIHIGTSGWSYKHWKGNFYPHRLAAAKWLNYYGQQFFSAEINGSFYRLPSEQTVLKWEDQVPKNFYFCAKMSRYLTHRKKLNDPEEPLLRFFSVFDHLKQSMGPILIQLPPMLKFNAALAEHFYLLIKTNYKNYAFVLEVRHDSWLQDTSILLLRKYDIGFVISQSANFFPYAEEITAKDVYLRFHGPADLYASSYSDDLLKQYAKKIKSWVQQGHTIWAYFNNDIHCYAPGDAQRLMKFTGLK